MRYLPTTALFLMLLPSLMAQDQCGAVGYSDHLLRQKGLTHEKERYEQNLQRQIRTRVTNGTLDLTTTYTIPVVFHCVYKLDGDRVTVAECQMALARLNEDFNNLHSDFGSIPSRFSGNAGNMNIRFVMSAQDPEGNPTNGVVYHRTAREFNPNLPYDDDFMKRSLADGSDAWDTQYYLNVWVARMDGGPVGYSTFPENYASDPNLDGVVIHVEAFGIRSYNLSTLNYNRTMTHEVGHWLSLRHIWGDDEENVNNCSRDDGVDDTPLQAVASRGLFAPNFVNISCGNGPKGDMWMNFMDYSDHLSRLMFTNDQVLRSRTILETTRAQIIESDKYLPAWHNRANFPVFRSNAFTALAIGKNHSLWAGTSREGLYKHNGTAWEISNGSPDDHKINHMLADKTGGIWIAQQGTLSGGAYAAGGGLHYYPDGSVFTGRRYFGDSPEDGLPSRSARSLWIDTTYTGPQQPRVWVATMNQINPPNDDPSRGGIGLGLNGASPFFSTVTAGLNTSVINTGCYTVGGDGASVYVFAPNNGGSNQILQYNAESGGLMNSFDHSNTNGAIEINSFPKAIYCDKSRNTWIGMSSNGLAVRKSDGSWLAVRFPALFPPGTLVNYNAIVGDDKGQVFIGTTNGLVVFNGNDPALEANYRRVLFEDQLTTNNVTALCVDYELGKLVIATDLGITWRDKDCFFSSCIPEVPKVFYSLRNGNWNSSSTWNTGAIPDCKSIVVLYHRVTVNTDEAVCSGLFVAKGTLVDLTHKLNVTSGIGCN